MRWSAAIIVLGAITVAGCGGTKTPAAFTDRAPLPNCGTVDSRDGLDDAERAAIACLTDAHAASESGELVVKLNGTEGELLVRYVRALNGGSAEVFSDNRHDSRASTDWSYQNSCQVIRSSPFEVITATECGDSASLG
jgi:hypothetical protein